jgi:hypothetical protein
MTNQVETDYRTVNNNSYTTGGVNPTLGRGGDSSNSESRGHTYYYNKPSTVVYETSSPDVIFVNSYGRRGAHTNCLTVALFILIVGFGFAKASPEIAGRIVVITLVAAFAVIAACAKKRLRLD